MFSFNDVMANKICSHGNSRIFEKDKRKQLESARHKINPNFQNPRWVLFFFPKMGTSGEIIM